MANNRPTSNVRTYQARRPAPLSPLVLLIGGVIIALMAVLLIVARPNPDAAAEGVAGVPTTAGQPVSAGGLRAPSAQCAGVAGAEVAEPQTITTASGLQYQVLREGAADGARPTAASNVTVNYEGRLESGSIFDSSYQRGQPASFPLTNVIAGWTEGLQLMNRCALYRFTIPGNLAYGANPPPGSGITPNATLIFDVELISF